MPPVARAVFALFGARVSLAPALTLAAAMLALFPDAQAQADCSGGRFADGSNCVTREQCRNNDKVTFENQCVTPEEKCRNTPGWTVEGSLCAADAWKFQTGGGDAGDFVCRLNDETCANFFGDNLDFPEDNGGGGVLVFNCDADSDNPTGLIPATINTVGATDCACVNPNHARVGRIPFSISGETFLAFGYCYPEFGRIEVLPGDELCEYHGGNPDTAGGRICSGIDAAETFCLLGGEGANFACRGLLRHVRRCERDFNRPALNPFLCGPRCGSGEYPVGGVCARGNRASNDELAAEINSGRWDAAVVSMALENGADPNFHARAENNERPLVLAARAGNAEMIRLLLRRGANANARENINSANNSAQDRHTIPHLLMENNFAEIQGTTANWIAGLKEFSANQIADAPESMARISVYLDAVREWYFLDANYYDSVRDAESGATFHEKQSERTFLCREAHQAGIRIMSKLREERDCLTLFGNRDPDMSEDDLKQLIESAPQQGDAPLMWESSRLALSAFAAEESGYDWTATDGNGGRILDLAAANARVAEGLHAEPFLWMVSLVYEKAGDSGNQCAVASGPAFVCDREQAEANRVLRTEAIAETPNLERIAEALAFADGGANHAYEAETEIVNSRTRFDAKVASGTPVLIAAGIAGNAEVVAALLRAGADANATLTKSEDSGTMVRVAVGGKNFSLPFVLLENGVWGLNPTRRTSPRTLWKPARDVFAAFAAEVEPLGTVSYNWKALSGNLRLLDIAAQRRHNALDRFTASVTVYYDEMIDWAHAGGVSQNDGSETDGDNQCAASDPNGNDSDYRACYGRERGESALARWMEENAIAAARRARRGVLRREYFVAAPPPCRRARSSRR